MGFVTLWKFATFFLLFKQLDEFRDLTAMIPNLKSEFVQYFFAKLNFNFVQMCIYYAQYAFYIMYFMLRILCLFAE